MTRKTMTLSLFLSFVLIFALIFLFSPLAWAVTDITWNGPGSGTQVWETTSNWNPATIPAICSASTGHRAIITNATGNRTITTNSTAKSINSILTWSQSSNYVNKLQLGADLTTPYDTLTWANTSGSAANLVLDLNGHTFWRNAYYPPATGPYTIITSATGGVWKMWGFGGLPSGCVISSGVTLESTVACVVGITGVTFDPTSVYKLTCSGFHRLDALPSPALGCVVIGDPSSANVAGLQVLLTGWTGQINGDMTINAYSGATGGDACDFQFHPNIYALADALFMVKGNWTDAATDASSYLGGKTASDHRRTISFNGNPASAKTISIGRTGLVNDFRVGEINDAGKVVLAKNLTTCGKFAGRSGTLDVAAHTLKAGEVIIKDDTNAFTLNLTFGSTSGQIVDTGALTLNDFTLNLSDGGGWTGSQDLVLMTYSGTLTNNMSGGAPTINAPSGYTWSSFVASGGQVKLTNFSSTVARIADGGAAQMSIVTQASPSARVQAAAEDLRLRLNAITGGSFTVTTGDGTTGIAVGDTDDFPALNLPAALTPTGLADRDKYLLRTRGTGIYVIGASDTGVENACNDLLYRIGYRQFLPSAHWECIPSCPTISLQIDVLEQPDYVGRRIGLGGQAQTWDTTTVDAWCRRNRLNSDLDIYTNHMYDFIKTWAVGQGQWNDNYWAMKSDGTRPPDGSGTPNQLCVSNPGLQQVCINFAKSQFDLYPDRASVSMEANDNAEYCHCDTCAAISGTGSPASNQAVYLANKVHEGLVALGGTYANRWVGIHSYSAHSNPPTISVDPNIGVTMATWYQKDGYRIPELQAAWAAQGAVPGLHEYTYGGQYGTPGRAQNAHMANIEYLLDIIPACYNQGQARLFSAEFMDVWGNTGLGMYLTSRMLWDIGEASNWSSIRQDYLDRAFGPASADMDEFYTLVDGNNALWTVDLIGRMYGCLSNALSAAESGGDTEAKARICDLVYWTRHCELYKDYLLGTAGTTPTRQDRFRDLLKHAWRIRNTEMADCYAVWHYIALGDSSVTIPSGCAWTVPEGTNPWKEIGPYNDDTDAVAFISNGIANNPTVSYVENSYSMDMVPAGPSPPAKTRGTYMYNGAMEGGDVSWYAYIGSAPHTINNLQMKSGGLNPNTGFGALELFRLTDGGTTAAFVCSDTVADDVQWHSADIAAPNTGLYRLDQLDGGDNGMIKWDTDATYANVYLTRLFGRAQALSSGSMNYSYFYVPKGTTDIWVYTENAGGIKNDTDCVARIYNPNDAADWATNFNHWLPNGAGLGQYFRVPVDGATHAGKFWCITSTATRRVLLNVPPQMALSPKELLLPSNVVDADKP